MGSIRRLHLNKLKSKIYVNYHDNNYGNSNSLYFEGETEFIGENDFIERCEIVKNKLPDIKRDIQAGILDIDSEILKVKCYSLKEMIENYEIKKVLPDNVRENKLLVFLLRKGYINEDYSNYINYFYPNTMTVGDMNFILSVRNHEEKEFEYSLTKLKKIIEKLEVFEFQQKEIYNFDLLEYLLSINLYIDKRDCLIKQLSDENIVSWNFINEFVEITKFKPLFISLLSDSWDCFWNFVSSNNAIPDERKMYLLNLICSNVISSKIVILNNDGQVKKYFESHSDILQKLENVSLVKIQEIIEGCNVIFTNLEINGVDNNLLDWIFDNGRFSLTSSIVIAIFNHKNYGFIENLETKNYTTIKSLKYTPLLEAINDDVENYIEKMILSEDKNIHEDLVAVLELIDISKNVELSTRLIEKELIVLNDLHKCEFEFYSEDESRLKCIWDKWINSKKIVYSWSNLVSYWELFGVTNTLLNYVEDGIKEIIRGECPEDINVSLIKEMITSSITVENLRIFISNTPKIDGLEISEISEENLKILMEEKYFDFNPKIAKEIYTYYPDLFKYCLVINIGDILSYTDQFNLKPEDVEYIIDSELLSDEIKVKVLTQSKILFTKRISYFLFNVKLDLDQETFKKGWLEIELSDRYQYFLNQINNIDNNEIAECLSQLEDIYVELADRSTRHLVKLYKNEYNIRLTQKLRDLGYLTSFKENGDLIECWVKKV